MGLFGSNRMSRQRTALAFLILIPELVRIRRSSKMGFCLVSWRNGYVRYPVAWLLHYLIPIISIKGRTADIFATGLPEGGNFSQIFPVFTPTKKPQCYARFTMNSIVTGFLPVLALFSSPVKKNQRYSSYPTNQSSALPRKSAKCFPTLASMSLYRLALFDFVSAETRQPLCWKMGRWLLLMLKP